MQRQNPHPFERRSKRICDNDATFENIVIPSLRHVLRITHRHARNGIRKLHVQAQPLLCSFLIHRGIDGGPSMGIPFCKNQDAGTLGRMGDCLLRTVVTRTCDARCCRHAVEVVLLATTQIQRTCRPRLANTGTKTANGIAPSAFRIWRPGLFLQSIAFTTRSPLGFP